MSKDRWKSPWWQTDEKIPWDKVSTGGEISAMCERCCSHFQPLSRRNAGKGQATTTTDDGQCSAGRRKSDVTAKSTPCLYPNKKTC